MVESIARGKKRILPCAAWLEGEYGESGIFLGVPCKLGTNGLEEIVEVALSDDEKTALAKSASAVRSSMEGVEF
jgi:malate dehydrogenase